MHTIKLKISNSAYNKFLGLLSEFNDKDIVIIREEDENFSENQVYLQKELENLNSGKSKLLSQQELEERLNKIV